MHLCSQCGKPRLQEHIVLGEALRSIHYYTRRVREMAVGKHTCTEGTAVMNRIMERVELYQRGNQERLGMSSEEIANDEEFSEVLHATFLCLQRTHSNVELRQYGILLFNQGLFFTDKLFLKECPVKSIRYKRSELIASVCGQAFHTVLPCLREQFAYAYQTQYDVLMNIIQDQLAKLRNRATQERDGKLILHADLTPPPLPPPHPPPLHARRAW